MQYATKILTHECKSALITKLSYNRFKCDRRENFKHTKDKNKRVTTQYEKKGEID